MRSFKVFDNGGKTADRYSLVYLCAFENGVYFARGCSDHPSHPQGIGMSFECAPEFLEYLEAFETLLTDEQTPPDVLSLAQDETEEFKRIYHAG